MRRAFAAAIEEAIRSRASVGAVAEHVGLSDDAVRKWTKAGAEPPPLTVFAVERFLRLAGGELSRHLGYVPVGAISVAAAIEGDADLTDSSKRILLASYREARR